jgi:hypothetical protein
MSTCLLESPAVRPSPSTATPSPASGVVDRLLGELPDLTGSSRDVEAAALIRARAMRRLRLELCERFRDEVSARWWIEHRHQVCG